jgi:hypothetical protein
MQCSKHVVLGVLIEQGILCDLVSAAPEKQRKLAHPRAKVKNQSHTHTYDYSTVHAPTTGNWRKSPESVVSKCANLIE